MRQIRTVVLVVPFGQWLQNHRVLLLSLLDQVEQVLRGVVRSGRGMLHTISTLILLILVLTTYIVIIQVLLSTAITC